MFQKNIEVSQHFFAGEKNGHKKMFGEFVVFLCFEKFSGSKHTAALRWLGKTLGEAGV